MVKRFRIFSPSLLSAFFIFALENDYTKTDTLNFTSTVVAFIPNVYAKHYYLYINCAATSRGTSIEDEYKIKSIANPVKRGNNIFTVESQ